MSRDKRQIEVWDRRMATIAKYSPTPDAKFVELLTALALEPERALDIGCGPGRHLVWLAEQGWRVTGLDWSEQALANARAALDDRGLHAELVGGDLRTPPDLGPPFRLAVATRVFHHGLYRDYERAMQSLRQFLASSGYAVLSLPSAELIPLTLAGEWVEERTFVPAEGEETGVPHHFFTAGEVRQSAAKFSSVDIREVREEYEEQTPQGPQLIRRAWLWVVLGG
jgi:SAM-dependent methyltransferase